MKKGIVALEILLIFTISLVFSMLFNALTSDDIWNYGFAYNISTGLIPYKDFNMIITPLYPMLGSLFLTIFGRSVLIYYIFNAIICTIIYLFLKKNYPRCYYILFVILLIVTHPNYNIMCLLWLFLITYLESEKKNDYLIGIVLGLTFITKQSIGIYLCIPTLFTLDIKKILKRIIGFFVPVTALLFYLLYNHTLHSFINYCFLGIGEFKNDNFRLFPNALIFLVSGLGYSIWQYTKTKDYKILYLICFFGMSYPIIDYWHTLIPFIPTFGHFLNKLKLNKKIISYAFAIYILAVSVSNIFIEGDNYQFPNGTNTFKYCKIDNKTVEYINMLTNYVKNGDKNTFIIDSPGYLVKLELGRKIDKYDLTLTGNLGKNGTSRVINELDEKCKVEKCTFILNDYSYSSSVYTQYNKTIHKYVIDNYHADAKVSGLSIYNNHESK